ncbi:hypothetical protein Tco_0167314 [Tanacetum coccineum]
MGLSIEIRKIIQEAEDLESLKLELEVRRLSLTMMTIIWDFMRFIRIQEQHSRCAKRRGQRSPLILGDGHINTILCVDDDITDDDGRLGKLFRKLIFNEKINAFSLSPPIPISPIFCPSSTISVVDLDLPLEEADVPSFSDDSILRGIESDRDSGEDTISIDALPLDDSMILSEYESFTFDDEPVMAEVNVFDEINTSELSYPGIGENVVLDEEEDTFTFTTRSFLPFVTYPEVLPTSYSTGSEDKVFKPGIFDNELTRKSSLTLDVVDPLHPPLMDFHVTKAFSGFTFSLLKIFSKKFFEPGIKNATVYLSYLVWGGFHLLDFLHPHYYPP